MNLKKKFEKILAVVLIVACVISGNVQMAFATELDNQITSVDEVTVPADTDMIIDELESTESDVTDDEDTSMEESDEESSYQGENVVANEIITVMDENGNITELEPGVAEIDLDNTVTQAEAPLMVSFTGYLEYTECVNQASGYLHGSYGADGLYLGTENGKVKFMISGAVGLIDAEKVQLISYASAPAYSYYKVSNGVLYHYVPTSISEPRKWSVLNNGPAPDYLQEGQKYLSYDGHYFYKADQYAVMQSDCMAGNRTNAINMTKPFFNYFQYLPLRSYTNYTGTELSNGINSNSNVTATSKLYNIGTTLVQHQNTYGTNALLIAGIAANESNWGNSNISQTKNNLFGINAIDSDPSQADSFATVSDCVQYYTSTMISRQYLRPGNWKYFGGFLGNKGSGLNVKYASDPYWGEKAAAHAWQLDAKLGNKDAGKYTLGVKAPINAKAVNDYVRNGAGTGYTKIAETGPQAAQTFILLNSTPENNFYKVQSDGVLNASRTAIDTTTGVYNAASMYVYISADCVKPISEVGSLVPKKDPSLTGAFTDDTEKYYEIKVSDYEVEEGGRLMAAVWSAENGQDDLRWNQLKQQADGTYTATVRIADHKSTGTYHVHAYYYNASGSAKFFKAMNFSVAKKEASLAGGYTDATEKYYEIEVADYEVEKGGRLMAAVWSQDKGQDDLRWNQLKEQSDGTYAVTIKIADYKSTGIYSVHVYYYNAAGAAKFFKSTTFKVASVGTGTINVSSQSYVDGNATVEITDLNVPAGITKVQVPIWSASNQNDIVWYNAVKVGSKWCVTMDIANHKYNWKNYNIHVYATDGNGFTKFVGNSHVNFAPKGKDLNLQLDEENGVVNVSMSNLEIAKGLHSIRVAMWSESGGQDDITWHTISNITSGWEKAIKLDYLKSAGKCQIHVYAYLNNGSMVLLNNGTFKVEAPTIDTIETTVDNVDGKFELDIDAPHSNSGVKKVEVEVWSKSDKSDLKRYTAKKQSDGRYQVASDISSHKYNIGIYQVHVYVTDGVGLCTDVKATTMTFEKSIGAITVSGDGKDTIYDVSVNVDSYPAGLKDVRFAVWSVKGGQDDIRWYTASRNGNTYSYSVDVRNHKTLGQYAIHVYGTNKAGTMVFLGSTNDMNVNGVTSGVISTADVKESAGTYQLRVDELVAPSGIKQVRAAIWTPKNGQDDIGWYTLSKQSEGVYTANVDIKNHKYNVGNFVIHVYVSLGNGVEYLLGATNQVLNPTNYIYVAKDQGDGKRTIGIQNPTNTSNLSFAVWSSVKGQDDIVWYSAKQGSNGAWQATVKVENHNDVGLFVVHAYSGSTFLNATNFSFAQNERPKTGWYYETMNGRTYKLYYSKGKVVTNVHDIIGRQSSYRIELNRSKCTVTVYAQDGANGYIIPVRSFACSVGVAATPTPTGTFYTSTKYRWHELNGPTYGQYCTRIVGGILFHSVPGSTLSHYNVSAAKYNLLGQPASQGCVRLCVGDAKWIYDNCASGTQVKIYDSSFAGPFGKPEGIKIPASQNWDPTDPAI